MPLENRRWIQTFFYFFLAVFIVWLAWPHLYLKGQVPVDGNVLRLFYPSWTFLHAHPPTLSSWPLWNPFRNMGEPFLADPQSMAAYPPMWLLCRLPRYLSFIRLWILGHTLLAAYFMAQWMMRRTKNPAAAAASAVVIAFNGYFMAHGSLPNHFASAAYLPMVFYFFDTQNVAGLGIALALQWLAGFPPFSFLTGVALLVVSAFSVPIPWKFLAKGMAVSLALSALQLLPFLELFFHSARPAFLNFQTASQYSEPLSQLLQMLFIPQWFAWQPQLLGDQAVVSYYVGPFVLVSTVWAFWKGSRNVRRIGIAVIGCFLFSLGICLPLFRFPSNWLLLTTLGLAWLSGIGISLLGDQTRQWMGTALIFVDLLAFAQYVRVPWYAPVYVETPPALAQNLLSRGSMGRLYHVPIVTENLDKQSLRDERDYQFFKEVLPPSYGMAFGLREVDSYQVLKLARAQTYQDRLAQEGPASPLLKWAGVSTVVTRKSGPGSLDPGNLQVVSLLAAKPALFFVESKNKDNITIEAQKPGHVTAQVETDHPNTLVFSEVSYPGWQIHVDGKEQSPQLFEETFLSVPIPGGSHRVEFRFQSLTFGVGLLISLAAVLYVARGFHPFGQKVKKVRN